MTATTRRPLEEYLAMQYPFNVIADEEGGYVVVYPDLPGCMTQVESLDELPAMAEDARTGWIETEYELGHDIPLPSYPETYSGRFVVRLPRSLHRRLAESAEREGVSLNQYVVALLAGGDAQARLAGWLEQVGAWLAQAKGIGEWKSAYRSGDSGKGTDKTGSRRRIGGAAGRASRRRRTD